MYTTAWDDSFYTPFISFIVVYEAFCVALIPNNYFVLYGSLHTKMRVMFYEMFKILTDLTF